MNRIKMILLMMLLIPTMAYSNSDDWLWESNNKPLDIDIDSTKTIIVCTPDTGCKSVIVYGD